MSHLQATCDGASTLLLDTDERKTLFATLDSFRSVLNLLLILLHVHAFMSIKSYHVCPDSISLMYHGNKIEIVSVYNFLKSCYNGTQLMPQCRQYRKVAHFNVTHRRRQNFYALPSAEWQLLSAPPFNFLLTLEYVDDAIDANADIAAEILKIGLESFGLKDDSDVDRSHWHGQAQASDLDKARYTIRQFYRDWSSEGAAERRASYGPVLQDIAVAFAHLSDKGAITVLVPGAGK